MRNRPLHYFWLAPLVLLLCLTACTLQEPNIPSPEPQTRIAASDNPVTLETLGEIGPWPVASRLIGYNGRLWFAGSVKGVNHNSADIWSMDLASGDLRFERSLFSQDAGVPLVREGLLHWPLEDALLAFGDGFVAVTDGENWDRLTIPGTPIYHTYEALDWQGDLLAMGAASDTALYRKGAAPGDWQRIVRHTAPPRKIARLKELTKFDGAVYAVLRDGKKRRLARWSGKEGERFEDVFPWPRYQYVNGLTVHKGALFALVGRGKEREIWRHDGETSYRVGPVGRFADLASDGANLWVVGFDGQLLSSPDGDAWARHNPLVGGRPSELTVIDGGLFAAGKGDEGWGIIWWQKGHELTPEKASAQRLPEARQQADARGTAIDWMAKGATLDKLLADPASFGRYGGGALSEALRFAADNGAPRGFFAGRLRANIASGAYAGFGSSARTDIADLAQVLLLSAMADARHAEVPTAMILKPWRSEANSYEKYIEPSMAAIHAVTMARQGDKATVDALIKRLDYRNDPKWLRSHVIGALTAATGQHFGYEVDEWQAWNAAR